MLLKWIAFLLLLTLASASAFGSGVMPTEPVWNYTFTAPTVTTAGDWDTSGTWQFSFQTTGPFSSTNPRYSSDFITSGLPKAGEADPLLLTDCFPVTRKPAPVNPGR